MVRKSARLEIRLTPDQRDKINAIAEDMDITSSGLVRKAVELVIDNPRLLNSRAQEIKDDIAIIADRMDTLIRMLENQEKKLAAKR